MSPLPRLTMLQVVLRSSDEFERLLRASLPESPNILLPIWLAQFHMMERPSSGAYSLFPRHIPAGTLPEAFVFRQKRSEDREHIRNKNTGATLPDWALRAPEPRQESL